MHLTAGHDLGPVPFEPHTAQAATLTKSHEGTLDVRMPPRRPSTVSLISLFQLRRALIMGHIEAMLRIKYWPRASISGQQRTPCNMAHCWSRLV